MKRWLPLSLFGAVALALGLAYFTTACEHDDDNMDIPTVDVTGTWHVHTASGLDMAVALTQTNKDVSAFFDLDGTWWTYTGWIHDGNILDGRCIPHTGEPDVTMSATVIDNEMRGTWSRAIETGEFSATR